MSESKVNAGFEKFMVKSTDVFKDTVDVLRELEAANHAQDVEIKKQSQDIEDLKAQVTRLQIVEWCFNVFKCQYFIFKP